MTSSPGFLTRAKRAAGRWRAQRSAPLVTVVVPVYQAEGYLDECLDTLRAQTHRRLQIVVVDDGSTDGSRAIYERHAAQDDRIETVRQENRGLGAARNVGIARALGEYVTFLDADDMLPPKAYAAMAGSLEESGSDFATGAVQRVTYGRRSTPAWIREVHHDARRAIAIDDYPRAVMDVIACNRMFRTSSWGGLGLVFPEGVAYEDHVPMMTAYVRGRFDILRETTYLWRIREDRTSIGQQKHSVANLRDRLEAKRGARAVLEREASPVVQAAWQARVLDMDLRLFIEEVPGVDDEYWRVLREGVREHVERATPAVWADVRVEQRIRAWLVAQDRRAELEELLRRSAAGDQVVRATVVGDAVVARLDLAGAEPPPAELLEVGARELELEVSLRSIGVDGDALVLVLAPRVGPVVDGLEGAELAVVLRDASGDAVELPATRADAATAERWVVPLTGPRLPDLQVVRIPADALPPGRGPWHVEAEYVVGARHFTGQLTARNADGSPGRPAPVVAGDRVLVPTWRLRTGLTIEESDRHGERALGVAPPASRPLLTVDEAVLTDGGVELRGRWHGTPPQGPIAFEAEGHPSIPVAHVVHGGHGGQASLTASWDEPPAPAIWRLRTQTEAVAWVDDDLLARLPLVVTVAEVRIGVIRDTDEAPALRVVPRRP